MTQRQHSGPAVSEDMILLRLLLRERRPIFRDFCNELSAFPLIVFQDSHLRDLGSSPLLEAPRQPINFLLPCWSSVICVSSRGETP